RATPFYVNGIHAICRRSLSPVAMIPLADTVHSVWPMTRARSIPTGPAYPTDDSPGWLTKPSWVIPESSTRRIRTPDDGMLGLDGFESPGVIEPTCPYVCSGTTTIFIAGQYRNACGSNSALDRAFEMAYVATRLGALRSATLNSDTCVPPTCPCESAD